MRPIDSTAAATTGCPDAHIDSNDSSSAASRRALVTCSSTTRASATGLGSTVTSMKPARSASASMRRISSSSQRTATSHRRGPWSRSSVEATDSSRRSCARNVLSSAPVRPVTSMRRNVLAGGKVPIRVRVVRVVQVGSKSNERVDHRPVIPTVGDRHLGRCGQPALLIGAEPDAANELTGELDADAVAATERGHWAPSRGSVSRSGIAEVSGRSSAAS